MTEAAILLRKADAELPGDTYRHEILYQGPPVECCDCCIENSYLTWRAQLSHRS